MLVRIKVCLNLRPLTPISDDLNDTNVLTPGLLQTTDYLNLLQQRTKWKLRLSQPLKVHDLLIVKEDNLLSSK